MMRESTSERISELEYQNRELLKIIKESDLGTFRPHGK